MQIINLDELERKCLEFGIKNKCFTKEDFNDENLVTISIKGRYQSKTIDIMIKGMKSANENNPLDYPITFTAVTWENLYYQLDKFFADTWDYIADHNKMPLYMKVAELIGKHSKGGFVNAGKIKTEIAKLL